jgi:tetratricopeptide (TPR) repeat protein
LEKTEPSSPRLLNLRKDRAAAVRDFAEFVRLDRLQPYLEVGGSARHQQALSAAMIYMALGHDPAAARARLENLPAEVRLRLEREPTNSRLWQDLAWMELVLGHNDEALRCARKGVELTPESEDADLGAVRSMNLALVYAWTGDKERAIAELARLLRIPSYANTELREGILAVPLRGDPRFEALLSDPKNDAPLF